MKRPIAISLSPNTFKKDILIAVKLLLSPWGYQKGEKIKLLEQWFRTYFTVSFAISFNSGRAALYIILKALGVGNGDEVLLQAFTCVAVPNSVIWTGATPVYIDIDSSYTLDIKSLEKRISKKTKAIIVQHTFGIPANLVQIRRVAKKYKLFVIEDCAHVIGGTIKNKKLGTFGDVSFFSFGRDKAFSCVFGGIAVTNNKELGKKIRSLQKQLEYPSFFWTAQQLFHPILFSLVLPFYNSSFIGKGMLVVFQKLHLLSFPVESKEKIGAMPPHSIKKLPNALAVLAILQLKRISDVNEKRKEICLRYTQELVPLGLHILIRKDVFFLRFPFLVDARDDMLRFFRAKNIYLGNWYSNVIDPKRVDFKKIFYIPGSCQRAEHAAKKIINLPTYPAMSEEDVEKVIATLKVYVRNKGSK